MCDVLCAEISCSYLSHCLAGVVLFCQRPLLHHFTPHPLGALAVLAYLFAKSRSVLMLHSLNALIDDVNEWRTAFGTLIIYQLRREIR